MCLCTGHSKCYFALPSRFVFILQKVWCAVRPRKNIYIIIKHMHFECWEQQQTRQQLQLQNSDSSNKNNNHTNKQTHRHTHSIIISSNGWYTQLNKQRTPSSSHHLRRKCVLFPSFSFSLCLCLCECMSSFQDFRYNICSAELAHPHTRLHTSIWSAAQREGEGRGERRAEQAGTFNRSSYFN